MESGVSFPKTHRMPCCSEDLTSVHSQPLGNTDVVLPADNASAIREGLEFMSHHLPGAFSNHAPSSFAKEIPLQTMPPPQGISALLTVQFLDPFNSCSLPAFSLICLFWLSFIPLYLSNYDCLYS